MAKVKCPRCGANMMLRTARRGRNKGNKFYGCSNYPRCKEIVSLDEANTSQAEEYSNNQYNDEKSLSSSIYPRKLIARPKAEHFQNKFFENTAVSEKILEKIKYQNFDADYQKAFSQWRLDLPIEKNPHNLNKKEIHIISVIEKILTRGRITLISPRLENIFNSLFLKGQELNIDLSKIENIALSPNYSHIHFDWFDSKEESIFYNDILPEIIGKKKMHYVLPQVNLESLVPDKATLSENLGSKRIDFALFDPVSKTNYIIEIDGLQHKQHEDVDEKLDEILNSYEFVVIRIKASDVIDKDKTILKRLKEKIEIKEPVSKRFPDESQKNFLKYIYSLRIAHQIQIVLLQAIQYGSLNINSQGKWEIFSDINEIGIFSEKESHSIIKETISDFLELLNRISNIYSKKLNKEEPKVGLISKNSQNITKNTICVVFNPKNQYKAKSFIIQNMYFPFHITSPTITTEPLINKLKLPKEKNLEYFLNYLFRKQHFWEGQYIGISRTLMGKDTLLLLPTGSGKSLVYQLSSLLLPGRTIIVDPIKALMEDQVDNLSLLGIDRCIEISSSIT
ncbi:MAG: topoisomerase DNA-binding C4 zinc finger domain-containing protein, partial [Promethearchaeota archaeon]